MQTSRGNSWQLCTDARNSTPTFTDAVLQSSPTTSPLNLSTLHTLHRHHHVCNECCCAYNCTILRSNTDQALKWKSPTPCRGFRPMKQSQSQIWTSRSTTYAHNSTIKYCINKILQEIRMATSTDPELKELMDMIHIGWPINIRQISETLKPYWTFRDEITVEDGIVLKGQPPSLSRVVCNTQSSQSFTQVTKGRRKLN